LHIKLVKIDSRVNIKINEKHSILSEEVQNVLIKDKAIFNKVGGKQYVALGIFDRFVTIFFSYDKISKEASVTTAYPSSKRQINSYKRRIRK